MICRLSLARFALLFCLVLGAEQRAFSAVTLLDNGVDPYNLGKGDWIWEISNSSTNAAFMTSEASKGMKWVTVKGSDGDSLWSQFTPTLVTQAHAAGLKIFAWAYVYGTAYSPAGDGQDLPGEIANALTLLSYGADGYIFDAEIEVETNAFTEIQVERFCQAIRQKYPTRFLAHAPFPEINVHEGFPYMTFGLYCNAAMPQDYWADIEISVSSMVSTMDSDWSSWQNGLTGAATNAIRPIVPIGQGFDQSSPAYTETTNDINTFFNLLNTDSAPASQGGYRGVSFWVAQDHTTADWNGISYTNIATMTTNKPVISHPPQNACISVSSNNVFHVTAYGAPTLYYQWLYQGAPLNNATNASYTNSNTQLTNAGSYSVIVTNSLGATTSKVAVLTVNATNTVLQLAFYDNFDTNSSALWSLFTGAASGSPTYSTNWAFDYSTQTYSTYNFKGTGATSATIPVAPNTTNSTRLGLKVTVNSGGAANTTESGLSLYPKGMNFGSNYVMRFDMWMNYSGVPGGSTGSTRYFTCGVNHTATRVNWWNTWQTASDGLWFAIDSDSDAGGNDYAAFQGNGSSAPTLLSLANSGFSAAGANDNDTVKDIFLQSLAPYPNYETPGAPSKAWTQVELGVNNGIVTMKMNGLVVAERTNTSSQTSGDVMIGFLDIYSSTATATNDNFLIIDNFRVYTLLSLPAFTVQPASIVTNAGANATFSATVIGGTPLSYQWRTNGTAITGATTNTLSLINVQTTNAGSYTLVVTNAYGAATSSVATLTIDTPPGITTDPQNQTVTQDSSASFNVVASGSTPLGYQWRTNGTAITGATLSSYTVNSAQPTNAGSYTVVVTNAVGSITSSVATLTVNVPAGITAQPTNQIIAPGGAANFSVTASGTATLYYQWLQGGTNLAGATLSSLSLSDVGATNVGSYTVIVTNAYGSITSSVATLTLLTPPTITGLSSPARTQRTGDHLAFLALGTSGVGPIYYQWSLNSVPISNATNSSLIVTNIVATNAGTYTVSVGNAAGTNDSGFSATLNVSSGYLAYAATNLVVARLGDGVQTLSGGSGNTVFLDQFTTNGSYVSTIMLPDKGTSALIDPGAGNDYQNETSLTLSSNQQFINFTGYFETYPFNGADLTVGGTAYIRDLGAVNGLGYYTLAYTNEGLYSLGSHFIRAAYSTDGLSNFWTTGAAGTPPAVKYLSVTNAAIAQGSGIPGIAGSTTGCRGIGLANGNLIYTDASAATNGLYNVPGLPVSTTTSNLVINTGSGSSPNDLAASPDNSTIYIADDRPLASGGGIQRWDTNSVAGGYALSYTLPVTTTGTNGARALAVDFSAHATWGSNVVGAVLYSTTAAATTNNLVQIYDAGSSSAPAAIIATAGTNQLLRGVRFAPQPVAVSIVTPPQNITVAATSNAVFTVAYAGDAPFTFQWYNGATVLTDGATGTGSTITGSATASLTVLNTSSSEVGSYSVTVSNPMPSSASSASATLNVINPVSITSGPATQTNNYGDTVILSVSATGGGTLAYAWKKGNSVLSNGGNITGSSTAALTLSSVAFSDGATYTAIVSNLASTNSAAGVLTVNDPIITAQPLPQTAECTGSAIFTVAASGTPTLAYKWYAGSTALTDGAGVTGSSSVSLTLSGVTLGQSGNSYKAVVTGSESVTSSVVSLTVHDTTPPVVTLAGTSTTNVECASRFTDPGATANDSCAGSLSVTASGSVNTNVTGTYLLTYSATDPSGNTGTAIRTVHINDTTPPVITLTGASTTNVECGSSFTDPGATANDACGGAESVASSGSVTAGTIGTYLLTYTASDANGNAATNTRTVHVVDTTAPVVTLNGSATMTAECHETFNDPGATANDACAGSVSVATSGNLDTNTLGTYLLTYSATDPSGNTGSAVRTVNVTDTNAPVITLNGSATTNVEQYTPFTDPGATASDECSGAVSITSSGSVDINTVGTYTLSYVATDPGNNSATNTRTVTVTPGNGLEPAVILTQPSGVTNTVGSNVTFAVTATGAPPLSYQWMLGGMNLSNGARISGSQTNVLTISSIQLADGGSYQVVVTNLNAAVTSLVATLTVTLPPGPPQFSSITVSGNGTLQLMYIGHPGDSYRLWADSDVTHLPVISIWTVLTNGTFGTGPETVTDATTNQSRYYTITVP